MTDRPKRTEVETAELLQEFGFSQYEAYVLVYLLQLGSGTAKDIAEVDHVPRTRVYEAVDSLHDAGLVDIHHGSPRRFTPVSRETALNKLALERENKLTELSELFEDLEPAEAPKDDFAVWSATGREAVASRLFEFIDDAEEELIYMTVDDLLTEAHLDRLHEAEERGVTIYVAGISEQVRDRIQAQVPSATVFETLWEWDEAGTGSLLITDEQTALVSILTDQSNTPGTAEVAIWGAGETNSLVVVLRTIFSWRLENDDALTGAL